MDSPQNIKKRLKSTQNIGSIAKAMELVSATKMRKSQEIALASRPYAFAGLELLANLSVLEKSAKLKMPELFEVRKKISRVLFIVVSSDKGLAGAFNSSIFKKFEAHLKIEKEEWKKEEHLFLAVGEKANAYLNKKGFKVVKKFVHAGDFTTPEQVKPLVDFILKGYLKGGSAKDFSAQGGPASGWDRVIAVSTHFKSALKQEPHIRRVLPIDFEHVKDTIREIIPEKGKFADLIKEQNMNFLPDEKKVAEYLIEPNPQQVIEKLAEHLFFMQIYHLILEANASEHSSRRMAMKTASDNAKELGENLNLQYNKSRQARITTEIAEISAGAEAQQ